MTDQILTPNHIFNFVGQQVNVRINEAHLITGTLELTNEGWERGWLQVNEVLFRVSEVASIAVITEGIFIHVQVDKDEE